LHRTNLGAPRRRRHVTHRHVSPVPELNALSGAAERLPILAETTAQLSTDDEVQRALPRITAVPRDPRWRIKDHAPVVDVEVREDRVVFRTDDPRDSSLRRRRKTYKTDQWLVYIDDGSGTRTTLRRGSLGARAGERA
jgi:hypothetical protein